jgi:hypothetical protein
MTRPLFPLASCAAVLAAAALVGGCGDLSQEDLLFRAALPPKDVVALEIPGAVDDNSGGTNSAEQGLGACTEGDVRCDATEIAEGFNGLTFGLLDAIDDVTALPPSLREPGRRVWGPHFDIAKGTTFRFEMVREDDGRNFSFCLHTAVGRVDEEDAADVDCDSADDALVNVFSGTFEPSAILGDGARQGRGTMRFEAEKVARLEGGERMGRVLDFAFDNRDGQVDIDVDVLGTNLAGRPRDAFYTFSRSLDGSGSFSFDVFIDLVEGGLIPRSEHVQLLALWAADQSGRAVGIVDEGDVDEGASFELDQCWDASLATIRYVDIGGTVVVGEEGTACAFAADDVRALGER